jgi:hypothetical protein
MRHSSVFHLHDSRDFVETFHEGLGHANEHGHDEEEFAEV